MSSKLPPIVLFGYDSSPFTQKIRLTLRLLQLPYSFVLVPSMPPRPVLTDYTNLGYRKIPVLAIGRDVIADTSLIVEYLHAHPALKAYREQCSDNASSEVHPDSRSRVLGRLLSSFFTDRPLFRLTTGLIPSVVWRTRFGEDRSQLIGHKLNAGKLEKKVPQNLAQLDTYLSILEPLFAQEEGWVLGTEKPTLADVSLYYQLDWGEKISRGEGIEDLTGGGTVNGTGEGMKEVFNHERYPGLVAWYKRFQEHVKGLPSVESRNEIGDEQGVRKLMERNAKEDFSEQTLMLNTPNQPLYALLERIGLRLGMKVSIAPDDTGRDNPTVGTLVGMSPEEVVIEPDVPQSLDAKEMRIAGVRLHFPRVGFVIVPARSAKL